MTFITVYDIILLGMFDASDIFKVLLPQIREIIKKVEGFNDCYTADDYLQEAYLACLQAKKAYQRTKTGARTKMQFPVFCQWYITKRLCRMADTGEVAYQIYTRDGEYMETLYNGEFRKVKKEYEKDGCRFRSVRVVEDLFRNWDGREIEIQLEGDINGNSASIEETIEKKGMIYG